MLPSTPLGVAAQFTATPFANFVTAAPTGQNAEVSNQKLLSIPPSTLNGATWFGTCCVPFAASELPLAVKRSGSPLMPVIAPVRPHPPTIQPAAPDCNQCLPGPKGNS